MNLPFKKISNQSTKRAILILAAVLFAIAAWYEQDNVTKLLPPNIPVYDETIQALPGQPITVAKAIDGDTIILANGQHLRYIGIDTPEEFDPRKAVQCYAVEAAAANQKLVEGKTIIFYPDVTEHDQYGRWLGYVYLLDGPNGQVGTFINAALVRSGYAFSYPYKPDTSKQAELNADEATAKKERLGLWANCTVHRTSSGREQTNNL